ncbi:hypothetical protein NCG89_01855 [Spongiibacter taiwanensis]|uniref:hypothetical protein n=1 Tax=Spongiibacter taiwanensis TaxID=1748242 RepID=UPI0020353E53|nr:hypothetical protein [Spongiibacter taiwanensis]USA43543.1 hypothetical protein NCG89_01855 [Spongiibacter taiwanensis]
MGWLIGIAVIAFMLAPIIWILPSPRQQRQTRLREAARLKGLQVRVTTLPQTRRQRVRREAQERVVSYTRPIHNRQPGNRWILWLTPQDEPQDDELAVDDPLREIIGQQRFPEDAELLEYTGLGLSLYWRERRADKQTVEALSQVLEIIIRDGGLETKKGEAVINA